METDASPTQSPADPARAAMGNKRQKLIEQRRGRRRIAAPKPSGSWHRCESASRNPFSTISHHDSSLRAGHFHSGPVLFLEAIDQIGDGNGLDEFEDETLEQRSEYGFETPDYAR